MITQEIKLYEEPKPVVYTPPATQQNKYMGYGNYYPRRQFGYKCSVEEYDDAIADAVVLCGLKVGDEFRFISTGFSLKVVGFVESHTKVTQFYQKPSVVMCERYNPAGEKTSTQVQYYSTTELFEQDYLEKV